MKGTLLTTLTLGLLTAGCGDGSVPSPTAPTVTLPAQRNVFAEISGFVFDTAFRPLANARVEIVDGSHAGVAVTTNTGGRFSFTGGQFVDGIKFRATKDGYVSTTVSGPLQYVSPGHSPGPVASLHVILESLSPPVKLETGNYTLTLAADSSCTDIPADLRIRTYAATITATPASSRVPGGTHYGVEVSGAFLLPFGFGIGVAGSDLRFEIDGPPFIERIPPSTGLSITGVGETSANTSTVSTIAIPFSGVFEYRHTPADQQTTHGSCFSERGQMILRHR